MFVKKDSALPPEHELVVTKTLGCALTVHRVLGPGFGSQSTSVRCAWNSMTRGSASNVKSRLTCGTGSG